MASLNRFDKRNLFDLSHTHKLTCDMGQLIPCLAMEVLPGDKIKLASDNLIRLPPMVTPMMQDLWAYQHFFFVPYRLLFDNWENFITGGKDNNDTSVLPYITAPADGGFAVGSLADYLGMPTGVPNLQVSALPFRAVSLIYNDWYRDENLIDPVPLSLAEGSDTTTNTTVLRRAWFKDYFTNALPWPQRGDPVYVPLGTTAPVQADGLLRLENPAGNISGGFQEDVANGWVVHNPIGTGATGMQYKEGLKTDLTSATSVTIDQLRYAIQVQQYAYLLGRAGYRYVEYLKSFFGVTAGDARLQRSEYLGGGKNQFMISEVLQTSGSDDNSPQANMAGHGITAGRSYAFNRRFEEHGIIIGFLSIMPRPAYQQGLYRGWSRKTRYDFYNPVFAHLGEQQVLQKELYAQGTSADDTVFGYESRYEEYRHMDNQVHGLFRTDLNHWHMGRIFDTAPTLSEDFINCVPTKRIFAVPSEPACLVDIHHHIKAVRPMPKFGNPGLMDHY